MSDEQILLDAVSSSDFKVSVHDKKRTDALEKETIVENKEKFGEDANISDAAAQDKLNDSTSLVQILKSMSSEKRRQVINYLKQNGLGDPLTKEKLIQNSFTVEKAIREQSSE